jgi:hypothetical protein
LKRIDIEKPVANYVRLTSDFDNIEEHPTFSLADRFLHNKQKYKPKEDADKICKFPLNS